MANRKKDDITKEKLNGNVGDDDPSKVRSNEVTDFSSTSVSSSIPIVQTSSPEPFGHSISTQNQPTSKVDSHEHHHHQSYQMSFPPQNGYYPYPIQMTTAPSNLHDHGAMSPGSYEVIAMQHQQHNASILNTTYAGSSIGNVSQMPLTPNGTASNQSFGMSLGPNSEIHPRSSVFHHSDVTGVNKNFGKIPESSGASEPMSQRNSSSSNSDNNSVHNAHAMNKSSSHSTASNPTTSKNTPTLTKGKSTDTMMDNQISTSPGWPSQVHQMYQQQMGTPQYVSYITKARTPSFEDMMPISGSETIGRLHHLQHNPYHHHSIPPQSIMNAVSGTSVSTPGGNATAYFTHPQTWAFHPDLYTSGSNAMTPIHSTHHAILSNNEGLLDLSNLSSSDPNLNKDNNGVIGGIESSNKKVHGLSQYTTNGLHSTPGPPIQTTPSNKGPDGANLFIFHIPNHFTNFDMYQLFCRYGNLLSVRIMVETDTGRSRGFGFVSYDNPASAALAIKELNGFVIGNKRLKVQHKQIRANEHRNTQRKQRNTVVDNSNPLESITAIGEALP